MACDRRDARTLPLLECSGGSKFTKFPIKTGDLTNADKDAILELVEQGLKAWTIARRIKRHPSSISWFMYREGLQKIKDKPRRDFMRNGRMVYSFDKAEDDFITDLRIDGWTPTEIAEQANEQFGRNRTRDTVALRLLMLASNENVTEVA